MKKETIHIDYPKNVTDEIKQLLQQFKPYSVSMPRIRKLNRVFVTHDGLVLKNGLLVNGCAFNLKGKEDKTFYYFFWRDTLEKYAVCKWGKSLVSKKLRGPQSYLLIHSKWFNYAFWVNSFLPRLIQAEEAGILKTTKLLVPQGWKKIPYVWESLKAFDVEKELIPIDCHLFVDQLIMPETRKWTSSFVPITIQKTRDRLKNEAISRVSNTNFAKKKIYLTRAKRGVRCVENEDGVQQIVQKYGYNAVSFEELSIWEQINLMQNTTHLVSIHGAGLANLQFMQKNSCVLELVNRPYAQREYTFPFWKLANAAQLNYYMQLCDVKNDLDFKLSYGKGEKTEETTFLVNQNIVVDLDLLESNIKLMESKIIN